MAAYSSLEVASSIALTCNELGYEWNNTKIQKLLYCCYGCFLAAYNERLCDEYPRAWQYGPVFPRVFSHIHKKKKFPLPVGAFSDMPEDRASFFQEAVRVFGEHSAKSLSDWSHREGSPWDTVVNTMNEPNNFIPDDMIRAYFLKHVVKGVADADTRN